MKVIEILESNEDQDNRVQERLDKKLKEDPNLKESSQSSRQNKFNRRTLLYKMVIHENCPSPDMPDD